MSASNAIQELPFQILHSHHTSTQTISMFTIGHERTYGKVSRHSKVTPLPYGSYGSRKAMKSGNLEFQNVLHIFVKFGPRKHSHGKFQSQRTYHRAEFVFVMFSFIGAK